MAAERLRIDELRLRVPGLSAEEAGRLGEEVARLLARARAGGAGGGPRRLGALDVRVAVPAGLPPERLAERIAEAIVRGLR